MEKVVTQKTLRKNGLLAGSKSIGKVNNISNNNMNINSEYR